MAAVLASGGGISGAFLAAQPAQAASTRTEIDAAVAQILQGTNAERAKVGLKPLLLSPTMNAVAQGWSEHMAAHSSMTHNPDYATTLPAPWMRVAENVAQGYTAQTVVSAWMASEGHRNNILGDFTHIGLGYWIDDTGRTWFTQNFGKYDIPATPTLIDAPVTTAGKYGFTANWTARAGEDVAEYRVDLRSSSGSLLQTQTVNQPTVTFTGLAVQTDYMVEVTARAIDTPGIVYSSATRTFTVTTLQDLPESTPSAVTFTDVDGTQNDTFTIPAVAGVDYLVGGSIVPAGTYRGEGTVTVTARAQPG